MSAIPAATLKPKEERRLLRGHLWAYRNEFAQLPDASDGDIVDVFSSARRFVGRGFYQASGGIAVRLLTRHQQPLDAVWFSERVSFAQNFRERLFPSSAVYRWIYGESDLMPGLIVDRFDTIAVVQSDAAFYLNQRDALQRALISGGVQGIAFDLAGQATVWGEVPETQAIEIDGVKLRIRPGGQKTGMFLDQRLNQQVVERFAPGARVLDGHCHMGVWGIRAAMAGASVLSVDTAETAIALAKDNAALNGLQDRIRHECGEVEGVLQSAEQFDVIILDPPAYAKARSHTQKALGRYQSLNRLAMEALPPGGILITCSCSHFVDTEAFLEVLKRAASQAGRSVLILEQRGAAPDHPVLLAMPETQYLKCIVARVM